MIEKSGETLLEVAGSEIPIDKIPPRLNILRSIVSVVNVVSMFYSQSITHKRVS
jgi:hypothetical protein